MKKAYFETSAVNYAVEARVDPKTLRHHLAASDIYPVIGCHVIYELAATFLCPDQTDLGKALFRFVRGLDPSITRPTMDILIQEVLRLRTNAAVSPFLPYENQNAARLEVHRLAEGNFDTLARNFIAGREEEVRREHPEMAKAYIEHVKRIRNNCCDSQPVPRRFPDVAEYFHDRWPELIRAILHNRITRAEARELTIRLNEFPAIRATMNANLYLTFICIAHESVPGDDKIDDYRHLIDASYCNSIVLYDKKAKRAVPHIAPQLQVLSLEDLW